ncbi:ROK family transcriptional regulator [Acidisoma cellulosilytica]|uniref:ROK family transcriptional regulator n=1 Tax=Acidisoma cellulosilyticum TaxID=2802395 RepID=A0A963Z672_9PROT|nr:ROK family transcriptional regulator [Acidisoma cellulosilyticum]MCB8883600.1 ROK family transcriptional regulator [Acidisoma cellulosilyticum]
MTSPKLRLRARVLDALQQFGPRSRADLARELGISRATAAAAVKDLLAAQLVEDGMDADAQPVRIGRPGSPVRIRTEAAYLIGIDFGRLTLRIGIFDLAYQAIREEAWAFDIDAPAEAALDRAAEHVEAMITAAGIARDKIRAVGVGVPGPVDAATGMLHAGSILASWVGTDVPGGLARRLDLPVYMDNDANLGALAEMTFGGAKTAKVALYVLLSVGVGLGIVINGRVFRGASGIAGELGHVVTDERGAICRCGSRGCLEAQVSVNALRNALQVSLGQITTDDMLRLAAEGHIGAGRVVADAGAMVGRAVGDLCNYFNPDVVLVGGELMRAGSVLLNPLRDAMQRFSIARATEHVRIAPGALGERAELLGTLLFASEKARQNPSRPTARPAQTENPSCERTI